MRRRTLVASALVLVAVVVVRTEIAEPRRIGGDSMSPTLEAGDVVLVEKVDTTVSRGDLVTFQSPADGEQTVKRVVGVAGDVVAIRDAFLYVNGRLVQEPDVDHDAIDGLYYGPVTVPADRVLVLGDNRARSIDSRAHGPIDVDSLSGTVLLSLWPPGGR